MTLEDVRATFLAESKELLEEMETRLLELAEAEVDAESVNAIFRAAHTIKGSAGLFGLEPVVEFTHVVEGVLDALRAGNLGRNEALVGSLLRAKDHLARLIEAVAADRLDAEVELVAEGTPLVAELGLYVPELRPFASSRRAERVEERAPSAATCTPWRVRARFGADLFRGGMDPLSSLRYLATLGRIVRVRTLEDLIPSLDALDPESCHLGFELELESSKRADEIRSAFEFVSEGAEIVVEALAEPAAPAENEPSLVEAAPVEPVSLEPATVEPAPVVAKVNAASAPSATEARSVRVDAEKLDHLINLVGELIIAAASSDVLAKRTRIVELQEATSTLSSLVEELRDSALQLRMVKIGATFARFRRVVHDAAHALGKDIALVVSGEDTELDKTVVEKIADPLMHLVRNAVDHGIEPAAVRLARGKPAQGTVRLHAYHDSGSIVIEVSDDGGGLVRSKILAKAMEKGLVEPGRTLSDREIQELVFEPGFSTSEAVTNLSGRGVGMDVVKRNITALRGTVELESEEGVGTIVRVRMPLTLAIIDGFLVGLGSSTFVVPLEMIEECVELVAEPGRELTSLRGSVLPFVRLRSLFGIAEPPPPKRENVVVVRWGTQQAGLVVDSLLGEFQTVIKPLAKMFNRVKWVSGSTILGNGEIALILDVPALLEHVVGGEAAA